MKVTLQPKGEYLGSGNVYKIRSTSDHMAHHFVAVIPQTDAEDEIICSCKGFQNHKKCWHVEAVAKGDWD